MSKSSTTIELLPNPHPGEILAAEFLTPLDLSQSALARAIGVAPRRINEIVLGKRAITADTDLRLARYFGVSDGFFLGLDLVRLHSTFCGRGLLGLLPIGFLNKLFFPARIMNK